MKSSNDLGKEPIGPLLVKMAVPAAIGILVMSIYFVVDTIFVGRWVGTLGIAAITVVMPIIFLIGSFGMSIGVGGASIISRALGAGNESKASLTFGNMAFLTIALAVFLILAGWLLGDQVLLLFGGKGDILEPAREYFQIILPAVPCLAWAMMSNNVMRSEGAAKMAMVSMLVPALANLILDPILIIGFDMGLAGAAWATTISYFLSAGFTFWYFFSGRSELRLFWKSLLLKWEIVREIFAIGGVTLARQGTISILAIVLNHNLFLYGGEIAVAIFGIISRIMMFANFPVLGITQGFLPIAGYNYGAAQWQRVRDIIRLSIRSGTLIALGLFTLILTLAEPMTALFTTDPELLRRTPGALILVFLAIPLITVQLIGAAYFQAIGKALPALLLTLSKQGIFLIPLILIFPLFWGLQGIWYAFPVADVLAASTTYGFLKYELRKNLEPQLVASY
ncbi:MAG: MATE family efflux transporter [Saprospiraceae bacterium]|nr:MATE family efflux transporter [Saprospiraceae bacterium]MCB0626143.1 MATE family efflux transporter [Saprospiraceae bacterium]MCB0683115.1 MATE family efflux transporter [Saprospiraceae bacterium]